MAAEKLKAKRDEKVAKAGEVQAKRHAKVAKEAAKRSRVKTQEAVRKERMHSSSGELDFGVADTESPEECTLLAVYFALMHSAKMIIDSERYARGITDCMQCYSSYLFYNLSDHVDAIETK